MEKRAIYQKEQVRKYLSSRLAERSPLAADRRDQAPARLGLREEDCDGEGALRTNLSLGSWMVALELCSEKALVIQDTDKK